VSLPGLTGQSSIHGRLLLDRPVKPGDDSIAGVNLVGNALAIAAVMDVDRLLRNSDHAFDSSHNATDHTAHDGTDHSADRTGRALTYGGTMLAPTNNALGLGRRRKSGNNDDGHGELRLHGQTPPLDVCGFRRSTRGFSPGIMAPARGECGH
jgi:hypothetical protein